MMLLAGDFAYTDCLKKKEDSIDLYNKCRGRQPLKKMAEIYIKPGPEGNIERGRQPHKKMVKSYQNYIKPGSESNIERGRQPHKKMVKSYQNYIKPVSERNIEIYENYLKPLSEIHIKQLSKIHMKQLSEMHVKQLSVIYVKPFSEICIKSVAYINIEAIKVFDSVEIFMSCIKSTVEMYMKLVFDVYFRYIISTFMLLSFILFSLHLMFILLLAGDIETNPGPRMKKKSADVKKKVDCERKRQERHNESPERKSRRLETAKEQMAKHRTSETPETKLGRLESDRKRKVKTRQSESSEKKSRRLMTDRKRKVKVRDLESADRKSKRLETVKEKMAKNRASETPEKKSGRLESDRKRKVQTRASETPERKSRRLETVKEKMAKNRALETPETKSRRLETVKQKMAENRASETPKTKSRRLQSVKEKMTENRASETISRRLQTVKQKMAENRASETPEKKSRRLQTVKQNMAENRASETPETKSRRLQTVKQNMAENRASETPETKSKRLQTVKQNMAENRASETPETKSRRLQTVKQNMAENRASETPETKSKRLETAKEKIAKKRHAARLHAPSIQEVTELFQEKVKHGPVHVCTSCHRLMYRESVVKYEEKKYEKVSHKQIGQALQKFLYKSTDGNIWICTTCHRKLKQGKIPAQSKINNLDLDAVPDELSELNSIEIRLVSKRIPFMKMVALPRGRQTAIHGPAVNIPTNLDTICKLLPRLPKDSEILPMKLKRRLSYKGHYMYDSVHPERMMMALDWLKANNILYGDININDMWTKEWENADPELWKATSGIEVSDKPVSERSVVQLVSQKSSDISPAISPHTMEHLQQLCESRGFQIENVAGDGHCFYRSVQQQLLHILGCNENHVMLRKQLAEFLDKHPNGPNGDIPYRQFVGNRLARTQDTACETDEDL